MTKRRTKSVGTRGQWISKLRSCAAEYRSERGGGGGGGGRVKPARAQKPTRVQISKKNNKKPKQSKRVKKRKEPDSESLEDLDEEIWAKTRPAKSGGPTSALARVYDVAGSRDWEKMDRVEQGMNKLRKMRRKLRAMDDKYK